MGDEFGREEDAETSEGYIGKIECECGAGDIIVEFDVESSKFMGYQISSVLRTVVERKRRCIIVLQRREVSPTNRTYTLDSQPAFQARRMELMIARRKAVRSRAQEGCHRCFRLLLRCAKSETRQVGAGCEDGLEADGTVA